MKRTSYQCETNNNEHTRCELPVRWSHGHRVRKLNNEINYNRQLINNFNN